MPPTKVITEREEELSPEQEKFCKGLMCHMKKDPEFVEKVADAVIKKLQPQLADVIEVASVQKAHPQFQEMKSRIQLEKELGEDVKKKEDE